MTGRKPTRPGQPAVAASPAHTARLLKADLHIHTARSGDSDISAYDIMEQARANRLDVVGVVDHNTCQGAIEAKRLAANEFPGLVVLVGQEVRTSEGEIIIFGVEKDLARDRPLLETCKAAKKLGGFIVIPHPFDITRHGVGKHARGILPYIDAVEVLNSKSVWKRFNSNARAFAEVHSLSMVAGSDAHFPQYIGMAYTLIDVGKLEFTEKDVYAAIRAGKTAVSGKAAGIFNVNLISRAKYLIKNARK